MSRNCLALVLILLLGPSISGQQALDRFGDPLPDGALARLGSVRFLHEDWVCHLAFLPGNKELFGACGRKACVWTVDSGRLKTEFPRPNSIMCAALSPDGKTAAVAENGNRIFLNDMGGGKLRKILEGNTSRAHGLAWSPDSRWLAAGMGHTVFLWDAVTGQLLHRLKGDSQYFQAVAFAPNGKLLIGGDRKAVQVWDSATGRRLPNLEGRLDSSARTLTFAPDGKSVVGPCNVRISKNSSRSSLRQWDTDGKKFRDLSYGTFNCAAFTPDGSVLAAGEGLNIHLWDPVSGKELRKWLGHVGHVTALAFSSDGKTLASGGYDQRIRLWDVATGKEVRPTPGHRGAVNGVAFSPNGKVIASAGLDATIRFWDWASGREIKCCEGEGVGDVALGSHWGARDVAFSPNGKNVVSFEASFQGPKFRLWSSAGEQLARFGDPGYHAVAVAFCPNNQTVVAAYADTIAVYEPRTNKMLRRFKKKSYLTALRLSPDGRKVAWVGQYGRPLGVFDLETGKDLFQTDKISASSLAFSPDGSMTATSEYQSVCLRNATTGQKISEWKEPAHALAFSPDGRFLAGATSRGFALWEVLAGQEVRQWRGHAGRVNALAFSPDGRLVVTASADGTLLVWDVTGLAKAGTLPALQLSEEELKNQYAKLTGTRADEAHRAIWTLAAAAPKSLGLIAKHLQPVGNDTDKIARLIAELDDKSFAVRTKAMVALIDLGERAEPALRRTLASTPPIEVNRRITKILGKLDPKTLAVKWLHTRRLLAAVEYAGTREARQLLDRLAAGAPDAPLTREAVAARKRSSQ